MMNREAFERWLARMAREHIIDDDYRLWPSIARAEETNARPFSAETSADVDRLIQSLNRKP